MAKLQENSDFDIFFCYIFFLSKKSSLILISDPIDLINLISFEKIVITSASNSLLFFRRPLFASSGAFGEEDGFEQEGLSFLDDYDQEQQVNEPTEPHEPTESAFGRPESSFCPANPATDVLVEHEILGNIEPALGSMEMGDAQQKDSERTKEPGQWTDEELLSILKVGLLINMIEVLKEQIANI